MSSLTDLKIDENFNPLFEAGAGDFVKCEDETVILQGIMEELNFPYFDAPDNPERGNAVMRYLNSDGDEQLLWIELKNEIKSVIKRFPFIKKETVEVSQDEDGVIWASFFFENGKPGSVPIGSEVS